MKIIYIIIITAILLNNNELNKKTSIIEEIYNSNNIYYINYLYYRNVEFNRSLCSEYIKKHFMKMQRIRIDRFNQYRDLDAIMSNDICYKLLAIDSYFHNVFLNFDFPKNRNDFHQYQNIYSTFLFFTGTKHLINTDEFIKLFVCKFFDTIKRHPLQYYVNKINSLNGKDLILYDKNYNESKRKEIYEYIKNNKEYLISTITYNIISRNKNIEEKLMYHNFHGSKGNFYENIYGEFIRSTNESNIDKLVSKINKEVLLIEEIIYVNNFEYNDTTSVFIKDNYEVDIMKIIYSETKSHR